MVSTVFHNEKGKPNFNFSTSMLSSLNSAQRRDFETRTQVKSSLND